MADVDQCSWRLLQNWCGNCRLWNRPADCVARYCYLGCIEPLIAAQLINPLSYLSDRCYRPRRDDKRNGSNEYFVTRVTLCFHRRRKAQGSRLKVCSADECTAALTNTSFLNTLLPNLPNPTCETGNVKVVCVLMWHLLIYRIGLSTARSQWNYDISFRQCCETGGSIRQEQVRKSLDVRVANKKSFLENRLKILRGINSRVFACPSNENVEKIIHWVFSHA